VCASAVYVVDVTTLYFLHTTVLSPWLSGVAYGAASVTLVTLVALSLVSHARAMLSNPGAVPANARPTDAAGFERHCSKCANFKPPRAHHCSICHRCVVKMDHHCPWINSCVGLANHKYFVLFVFYIFTYAAVALALMFGRFMHCLSPTNVCDTPPGHTVAHIMLAIVAILFGLFTGCLFFDQLNNIATNTTQIDRMKGEGRADADAAAMDIDDRKQLWHNLGEVFGGDPARNGVHWTWLLPTPVTFRDPEGLSGFCFRDVPRPRTATELEMV